MKAIGKLCLVVLALVVGAPASTPAAEKGIRVLFVGNSLTYTNDLPGIFEGLLKQGGVKVDKIDSVAKPNFGLQDHWANSRTRRKIERGQWDFVVLQQGPSASQGRPSLIEYSRRFAELIRRSGARPALYMVWPSLGRFQDFDGVMDSYQTAAKEADAVLLPAGAAWRAAWGKSQKLAFYGPDGFHPSPLGSYLAALVIYQGLTTRDPRELPPRSPLARTRWGAETIRQLQAAAAEASNKP